MVNPGDDNVEFILEACRRGSVALNRVEKLAEELKAARFKIEELKSFIKHYGRVAVVDPIHITRHVCVDCGRGSGHEYNCNWWRLVGEPQ